MAELVPYALCSVADVKLGLDDGTGADADELLILLINGFSKDAQNEIGFALETTERTELFGIGMAGGPGGPTQSVTVAAPPIDPAADLEVYSDAARLFPASSLLVENTDYVVNRETGTITKISQQWLEAGFQTGFPHSGRNGRLPGEQLYGGFPRAGFATGIQALKVVYTGGVVLWDGDQLTVEPDLRMAAVRQVTHWWKTRHEPGQQSIGATGQGNIVFTRGMKEFLPEVAAILNHYRVE